MPGAVGRLIASSRRQQRPPYSQQFVADELNRLGYPVTRTRISRLESSDPRRDPVELVAAIAIVLEIESEAVFRAILEDARTVEAEIRERLSSGGP